MAGARTMDRMEAIGEAVVEVIVAVVIFRWLFSMGGKSR